MLRLLLIVAIAVAFAAGTFALMRLYQSNVAKREAQLDRLLRAKTATKAAGKQLTADVAEYSSAYSTEAVDAGRRDDHEDAGAIDHARAANERIAIELQTITRAYTTVYGDAATQRLRVDAASAHDACGRSLEAWARANYAVSKREDQQCEQYGMELGNDLDSLGSRLDADITAVQRSLTAL